jgi:hypothetical protein
MSLGTARLDDLRRRSSVTKFEMSPANSNLHTLNGNDRQTGRCVCNMHNICPNCQVASDVRFLLFNAFSNEPSA